METSLGCCLLEFFRQLSLLCMPGEIQGSCKELPEESPHVKNSSPASHFLVYHFLYWSSCEGKWQKGCMSDRFLVHFISSWQWLPGEPYTSGIRYTSLPLQLILGVCTAQDGLKEVHFSCGRTLPLCVWEGLGTLGI